MGQNFTPDIKEKASIYVPAVGKVTIMILLRNLLVSDCSWILERKTDTAKRLVQNKPETNGKPAEAIEKPGTIEQPTSSG